MADLERQAEFSKKLTQWYWQHGRLREGRYALSIEWLNSLYDAGADIQSLRGLAGRDRASVAIWGPSQSGKSTLISNFLDDKDGRDSALTWREDRPFHFSRRVGMPEDVPSLNPFNEGSDASGCVTRFRMAAAVPDPEHPVGVSLGGRQEIMHALAAGYLIECRLDGGDGGEVFWDAQNFLKLMSDLSASSSLDQPSFEIGRDVVRTVDRLIADGYPRYKNLTQAWEKQLRLAFLRTATNARQTDKFWRTLLWDGSRRLSALFDELNHARDRFKRTFRGRSIRCSLDVAALLLDIDSFRASQDNDNDETRRRVRSIRYKVQGDAVCLGTEGDILFEDEFDFGLFQGLVWELQVPLKSSFIESQSAVLSRLLGRADLIDVPGVALQHEGRPEEKIDADSASVTEADLLTKVLKRGKTASIISRYARDREIDNLLLLARGGKFVASPKQLISGVEAIWRFYAGTDRPAIPPRVTTFLCLTFMSDVINQIGDSGLTANGLRVYRDVLGALGPAADPNNVRTFMVTYPQYSVGKIIIEDEMLPEVERQIENDAWFRGQFLRDDSKASLPAMLREEDGGVTHLLHSLEASVDHANPDDIVAEGQARNHKILRDVLAAALPQRERVGDEIRQAIDAFIEGINQQLSTSRNAKEAGRALSRDLRATLGVAYRELDIPEAGQSSQAAIRAYLEHQITNWKDRANALRILSKFDLNERQQRLVLEGLATRINAKRISQWLFRFIRDDMSRQDREHLRFYIATQMANDIVGESFWDHQTVAISDHSTDEMLDACQSQFDAWNTAMTPRETPHYDMVVAPILNRLTQVMDDLEVDDWEEQPGDAEIEGMSL